MHVGHNHMPLEDRIFEDPTVSVEDVLTAVASRIERQNKTVIEELTSTAKALADNKDRLPETFTQTEVITGLELLSRMDAHATSVGDAKDRLLKAAEDFVSNLKLLCKPLDAGMSPLEKSLRNAMTPALERSLDEHNDQRTEGEAKMSSLTIRSPSGAKATLIDNEEIEVVSPNEVPREFCIPDQKLLAAAFKEGKEVPGTSKKRKTSLRISIK